MPNDIPSFPWSEGDKLFASALNAAIANGGTGAINVKNGGAKGDGATDDTAAIQGAVNAIPASGGVLLFPPGGSYLISNTINLVSNLTIIGDGATIVAAPAAAWPGGVPTTGLNASGKTNITIKSLTFNWLVGWAVAVASKCIVFQNCTHVQTLYCKSNGAADQVAYVGCTDTLTLGCRATNFCNCAYDHWGGTTDARVIGCWASSIATESHGGMCCIAFTGINTDETAAVTSGFVCTDNIIYCNNQDAQAISLNGHATGGELSKGIVANNKVFVATGIGAWGIVVTGKGKDISIHHNYCEGSNSYSAVAAFGPCVNIRIEHNTAYAWNTTTSYGIFGNVSPGGTLLFNEAIACNQPIYRNADVDATTLIIGNDTGTGTYTVGGAMTVTGAAQFNVAMQAVGGVNVGWNGAGTAAVNLNAAAGTTRNLVFQTAGSARWGFYADATAEGGSNAGSNLILFRCNDGGSIIGNPLTINRATGAATFASAVQLATVGFNNTAPIAKPTVTGAKAGNAALASLMTALAAYGLVTDSTS